MPPDDFLDSLQRETGSEAIVDRVITRADTARTSSNYLEQEQLRNLANQISGHPSDIPIPNANVDLNTGIGEIDWNAPVLETMQGQFVDLEQMFDYFNVNANYSSANFNTFKNHGNKQGWKYTDSEMRSGSFGNEVIGNTYKNFVATNSTKKIAGIEDHYNNQLYGNMNPYFFLSSSYAPNTVIQHAGTKHSVTTAQYGNIVQNMYRYTMEDNLGLISPKGDRMHPDISNPFVNGGDAKAYDFSTIEDQMSGGPAYYSQTPPIFLMGFLHSKYSELEGVTKANGGYNAKLPNGDLVKIATPKTWVSLSKHSYGPDTWQKGVKELAESQGLSGPMAWATFGQGWSYLRDDEFNEMRNRDENVAMLSNTIRENNYIVQGDFISNFGKSHELLNVWQGDKQYLFPNTQEGIDITGKSFWSEESKDVPGFALTYTSGASLFAMGTKYNPYSKNIKEMRFGKDYPFEGKFLLAGDLTRLDAARNPYPGWGESQEMIDLQTSNPHNHFTMAFNLVSSHFDPEGYRLSAGGGGELASSTTTGMDTYNGSLANLGWDSNHRYATSVHEIDFAQTLNPNSPHWNYGKYYKNKAVDIHGGLGNLPTFNGFLKNQGYDDNDIGISNSAAIDKGKEHWMKHTKYLLQNVDLYGHDLLITQGLDQLIEAHSIVTLKNERAHSNSGVDKILNFNVTGAGATDIKKFFPTLLDTTN